MAIIFILSVFFSGSIAILIAHFAKEKMHTQLSYIVEDAVPGMWACNWGKTLILIMWYRKLEDPTVVYANDY